MRGQLEAWAHNNPGLAVMITTGLVIYMGHRLYTGLLGGSGPRGNNPDAEEIRRRRLRRTQELRADQLETATREY